MPSSVVHLFVANNIKQSLEIRNVPQFFLGAISPDAVNTHGFATEEVRYKAHIRSKDVSKWLENIRKFAFSNAKNYVNEADFFTGFLVHLLTDIAWDEVVQPRLFQGLAEQGISAENFKSEKWAELFRFNNLLFKDESWSEIKENLTKSHCVEISTVNEKMLEEFLQKTLLQEENAKDKSMPCILKFSDVLITSQKVLQLYYKYLL